MSPNEVKVYLAGLELGSATAQQLAAKAAVVRPTAYVAIGGLVKRGLMSSYTKGKKQYFLSEKPEQLLHLVQDEKRKIAERESKLKSLLPDLESLIAISGEKPEVKLYEGLEGLEAMKAVLFESKAKHIDVIGVAEKLKQLIPEEVRVLHGIRVRKAGISGRQIVIGNSKNIGLPEILPGNWRFKLLKGGNLKSAAEITIFGDYLTLIAYLNEPLGFLIKSKDIVGVAKILFDAAWISSEAKALRN